MLVSTKYPDPCCERLDRHHYSSLAHIVRRNNSIEEITVQDENRNTVGAAEWMKCFFESFKYNATVKTLKLSWFAGLSNGYELRPRRHSKIEFFSFRPWNGNDPYPGTDHLCYIVAGNPFLKELELSCHHQDLMKKLIHGISSPQTALEKLTIGLSHDVWENKDASQDSMLPFLRETQLKHLRF